MALNKLLADCLQLAWENMGDPIEWVIDDRHDYARDAHFLTLERKDD